MGIQGLIGLLEKASTLININQLEGSVCVVDAYGWLHRACYGCADQLYTGQHTDQYVKYCLNRTRLLINAGIKPIVVFDGQKLPAKELTHNKRQLNRHNIRQKIELLLSDGNEVKARELMKSCVEVTHKMANNLMIALREEDIDFIVAPFEADAQMAYLVNNGFADFVVTEDSDLLVYNCRLCLFKMDSNGNGRLVDISLIKQCLGNSFDANKLRHMSILSGCDYLPNLPGIGLQKSKKFFKMTANTDLKKLLFKIPHYLKMSSKLKVTQEYVNDFIKADNTFRYQLVFCPLKRQLVPLTPYEDGVNVKDLTYAGIHFSDSLGVDFAYQYAIGNVDIKTLKIIDSYNFEPKTDSIWSKDWINRKKCKTLSQNVLQKLWKKDSKTGNTGVNDCNRSKRNIESQNTDKSHKRIKVNENRFVNCNELLKEYSVISTENDKKSYEPMSYISINKSRIYSRNIFKVINECSEERTVQSKYFAEIQSSIDPNKESFDEYNIPMKTKVICEQNLLNVSQQSLNSSGNTLYNSFDETIHSVNCDTDRSEISETSDEEIVIKKQNSIKKYTNIKQTNSESSKQSKTVSVLNNSRRNSDIRHYFK